MLGGKTLWGYHYRLTVYIQCEGACACQHFVARVVTMKQQLFLELSAASCCSRFMHSARQALTPGSSGDKQSFTKCARLKVISLCSRGSFCHQAISFAIFLCPLFFFFASMCLNKVMPSSSLTTHRKQWLSSGLFRLGDKDTFCAASVRDFLVILLSAH